MGIDGPRSQQQQRSQSRCRLFKREIVYGDLSSTDLIEEESAKAEIVYHFANCDDEPSANAISRGLSRTSGFWIHTSGTGILTYETVEKNGFGDEMPTSYNDWDGIEELTSITDKAIHRNVDKIVLASGSDKVKTAIVCPPCI